MSDLLPCPFCGGARVNDHYIRDGRAISCLDCSGSVHAFQPNASQRAAEKWNARSSACCKGLAPISECRCEQERASITTGK